MTAIFAGNGTTPGLGGQPTNELAIPAGSTRVIPAGTWNVVLGKYTCLQQFDPITDTWRSAGGDDSLFRFVASDGFNYRIANLTGCVVAANVTNAGTGYTSAPTITDNGGSSVVNTYIPIIGGALSTTVTVTNGGKNYQYPPIVLIDSPVASGIGQGVQATATATISAGAVTGVTVVAQGAGYTQVPNFTFINDPRDTTGAGASAVGALTGAGTITAILVNPGTTITTPGTTPTITISGGGGSSAAAQAEVLLTTTAYTVTTAGAGYSGNALVVGQQAALTASAYLNPSIQSNFVRSRPAVIDAAFSAGALTATGQVLIDGGIFINLPKAYIQATGVVTTAAVPALTVGSVTDYVKIIKA